MNAESTVVLGTGPECSDAGTSLSLHLRRLTRALKFSLVRTPARPAVAHPLESLTFSNGTIYQLQGEQLAGEYMGLSGIDIVRKLSFRELDEERCEYRFELNSPTDPVWRFYLKKLLPNVTVHFESKVLVLTCRPADLEWSYQRAKTAIAQASHWYGEERERLISRVIAKDEDRRAARELERNRKMGLRRQFEYLQL